MEEKTIISMFEDTSGHINKTSLELTDHSASVMLSRWDISLPIINIMLLLIIFIKEVITARSQPLQPDWIQEFNVNCKHSLILWGEILLSGKFLEYALLFLKDAFVKNEKKPTGVKLIPKPKPIENKKDEKPENPIEYKEPIKSIEYKEKSKKSLPDLCLSFLKDLFHALYALLWSKKNKSTIIPSNPSHKTAIILTYENHTPLTSSNQSFHVLA